MDGTIVMPGKHEVSERVREAVIACENQGVEVVPVTGRPYEMAKSAMEVLGFDDLCVLDGGATIRKVTTGEMVWSKWLGPATLKEVVRAVLPYAREIIDYFPTQVELDPAQVDVEAIDEAAPYVFTAILNEDTEAALAALAHIPGIAVYSNPGYESSPILSGLQVTHVEADKYHGVAALLGLLNVTKDQVLGIGDSNNDLPLFKNAGLKVAMGNATETLKNQADHIVASVEKDGFAEAVERFVLFHKTQI
jgi:HAD superfamily hydrolase (TIGR01484 family)